MRSHHALSCFVALLHAGAGCGSNGTDLNQVVNVDPFAEAGAGPASSSSGSGASFQDPFAGAPAYAAQGGSGDQAHHPGESCLQSGCHRSSGSDPPGLFIGGTVYTDYAGNTPAAGIEVRVVDSTGNAVSVYSSKNGNFYLKASNAGSLTFPVVVGARDGTTTRPMITTLTSDMGSCRQNGCHVPGGGPTTTTGNYYPIHVP